MEIEEEKNQELKEMKEQKELKEIVKLTESLVIQLTEHSSTSLNEVENIAEQFISKHFQQNTNDSDDIKRKFKKSETLLDKIEEPVLRNEIMIKQAEEGTLK